MSKKIEVFELSDDHISVLQSLGGDDELAFYYRHVEGETGFDRKKCKKLMDELRKHDYAVYVNGLFNEDGETAGSGFSITQKGKEAIE